MTFTPFEIGVAVVLGAAIIGNLWGDHDRETGSWTGGIVLVCVIIVLWLLTYGFTPPWFFKYL